MINIKAIEEQSEILIEVSGHARYAPYGADIVCAGVSSIVFMLSFLGKIKEIEKGRTVVCLNNDETGRVALKAFKKTIEIISEKYPNTICSQMQKGG